MLILAHNRDELRMTELAELYGNDLQVPWQDDLPEEPDAESLAQLRGEFTVYLSARFFSKPEILPGIRPFYAVWEVEGNYVSALRVHVYSQGLSLEALCTAAGERGKGYATELLKATAAHLARLGHFDLYALVPKHGKQVQRILQSAGFVRILDYGTRQDPCQWPPYYYRDEFVETWRLRI